MEKKQTAVQWLKQICDDRGYFLMQEYFEQALQMEREQMKLMYEHGSLSLLDTGHGDTFEQYYTQTFNQ